MMKEQAVIAFIANLVQKQGVHPEVIEAAVDGVLDIKLGKSITDNDQLTRAFSMEQFDRLMKRGSQ